jgi:hypothetical protein
MKKIPIYNFFFLLTALLHVQFCFAQNLPAGKAGKTIDQRVDSVLKLMTLDEKVGQMNQYNGDWAATGPITKDADKQEQIRNGKVGSMLNVTGTDHTRTLQQIAMQSRLKIPLLFGQDVIHGYRTIFPIPLAKQRVGIWMRLSVLQELLLPKHLPQAYTGPLRPWLI